MLYYLFRFLEQYGISGAHMWGYISFRALLALIFSLTISAWFGERFIKYLKSKQITETQRDASIDPFGVGAPLLSPEGDILFCKFRNLFRDCQTYRKKNPNTR